MVAIEDHEPAAEHQKAAREWDEMRWIEQVEHAAGDRQTSEKCGSRPDASSWERNP
jgi:hypothetical protein